MKNLKRVLIGAIAVIFVHSAQAAELPPFAKGGELIHGSHASYNKAAVDTINLMGPGWSGSPYVGDFEAGWNGWTSQDLTAPTTSHWQVSDYNQAMPGNLAAWCGDLSYVACNDSTDIVGGYGNNWNELLAYRVTVANPAMSALVTITGTVQYDVEPGYDFIHLSVKISGNIGYTDLASWDDAGAVVANENFNILPSEYMSGTDIAIFWRMTSDVGWSDEDCLYASGGACQIDDVSVTVSQTGEADIVSFTDFQDGTLGDWMIEYPDGVGDFAGLWRRLDDVDICGDNFSQQVAFIDDGIVVPGTGGSQCINWCYGPGGYIVNPDGGLAGPSFHLNNAVNSPVMDWPDEDYDGMMFSFDVYDFFELGVDTPGVTFQWFVRSADVDGSAGAAEVLSEQEWVGNNFVYYAARLYLRSGANVTGFLHPGRDEVQVQLRCYEIGWAMGYNGLNGNPAPYFDNVSVKIFPIIGAAMSTRELDLAQDNFPEIDALPTANGAVADAAALATMHVRFDMANNISLRQHMRNDPGDSIVVDIVPLRAGASLTQTKMHYSVDTNPVFDGARIAGFSATGVVVGRPAVANGIASSTKWAFDLPDTGFLFPGDVLHYYFRAGDDLAGDVIYSTLPDNISGFGDFSSGPLAYDSSFTMHALPSLVVTATPEVYSQPKMLFWNDNGDRGSEEEWYSALAHLGYAHGVDYDIYYTNEPSSGVGNGIGGRTSGLALEDYESMLYSAGSIGRNTLSNGDFEWDAGDDISAVLTWLSVGNKNMYLTGDSVANDMGNNAGAAGLGFLDTVMGLNLTTHNVRSFIDNQTTPLVLAVDGNSVVSNIDSWIAYGGCNWINAFDGVTTRAGAESLAEFSDPSGAPGAYSYSALTLNVHDSNNPIISQPFDFGFLHTDPEEVVGGLYSGRVQVLADILAYFGSSGSGSVASALPRAQFTTSQFPNPFNPTTKISYTIKAPGHLSLKVFNVRGELVKTLIDGSVTEDGFEMWDGTNNQGSEVSSGVYFYEARMGSDVQVNKMALIK